MENVLVEGDVAGGMAGRAVQSAKVMVLLLLVAVVFSYLGAYALTNALVSADLLERWPAGHDPRPRWMLTTFASMSGAFLLIVGSVRFAAWRQMKRLDDAAESDG